MESIRQVNLFQQLFFRLQKSVPKRLDSIWEMQYKSDPVACVASRFAGRPTGGGGGGV